MSTPRAIDPLEATLRAAGTPERADKERAYLKSALTHLGVPVPVIRRSVRAWRRELGPLDDPALRALVEALWARPVHELRAAAVELLMAEQARLGPDDMPLLERLLAEARTWALLDNLAVKVVGPLVARHPALADRDLDRWARHGDFWLRRAALLSLLLPLRAGGGDWARFTRYADAMLPEKEFFIRKAIGWVLREAAKKRPERVVAYLEPRAHRASGLTLREATRPLPAGVQARLRAAHAAGRPAAAHTARCCTVDDSAGVAPSPGPSGPPSPRGERD